MGIRVLMDREDGILEVQNSEVGSRGMDMGQEGVGIRDNLMDGY